MATYRVYLWAGSGQEDREASEGQSYEDVEADSAREAEEIVRRSSPGLRVEYVQRTSD